MTFKLKGKKIMVLMNKQINMNENDEEFTILNNQ